LGIELGAKAGFGVDADVVKRITDAEIEALVAERQAARNRRDFQRADEIRQQLAERGIILEDTRDGGVRWKRK
jgi:cysteinyl-tRNA synthetase